MTSRDDIHDVYAEAKAKGAEAIYRDWAAKYDADNAALGFRLPAIAAAFAARHLPKDASPLLDAGCGTGQVGETLKVLGYRDIAGLDLSPDMLTVAQSTHAYASLTRARLGDPLPYDADQFAGTLCIGSFGPGHAPPSSLRELVRVTRPGGMILFNVVEATWKDQGFPAVCDHLTRNGAWQQIEDSGPFRPYTIGEPDLLTRLFVCRVT